MGTTMAAPVHIPTPWGTRARAGVVPPWMIVLGAAGAAALTGSAMTVDVRLGIGAALGIAYVPIVLINLQLAIVLWIPFSFLIAADPMNAGPLGGVMIVVAWAGALAVRGSEVAALVVEHRNLLICVAALVLWVMTSMAWAQEAPIGESVFFEWIAAALVVLVISTALTSPRYLRLAAAAFVLGAVISVALGLVGGAVQTTELDRAVGGIGDANVLAAGIMPAIVVAAGLAAGSRRFGVGLLVLIAVVVLTIGLVATGSRGGFVAGLVGAAAMLALGRGHRAGLVVLLLCVIGAAAAWFSVDTAAWERVSDISGGGTGTGRSELWATAWQMWQDHPLVGVGLEAFRDNASSYVRELGPIEFASFLVEQPKVVHNTYLQLLAETGILGLALYLVVIFSSIRLAWRAALLFERIGDLSMATLSRAVIGALVAMLAGITFISAASDRRLWILLALGPALFASAKLQARRMGLDASSVISQRRARRLRAARPPWTARQIP